MHRLVTAARALQPLVRAHAESAEQAANPDGGVIKAMAEAGLFKVCAPAAFGGEEADPRTTIGVIEAISEADGGTGWALMIGIETVGLGLGWMPPDAAASLVAETPNLVLCGALNPQGVAIPEPGGYRVSGQWPFGSGCMHADYFWGMCVVKRDAEVGDAREREGRGSVAADVELLEVLIPRASYEVIPTWQVNGLRSSGSHDVRATDVFVPEDRITRTRHWKPRHDAPLFRLPPYSRLAYNKVGVSFGIARAAIDAFVELCNEKRPRLATSLLRDRPRAQLAVAEAEAALRSARAFVFEVCDEQWETVQAGGVCDRRQRALMRLACSRGVQEAARAVDVVCAAAGTSPNPASSLLGRCWRDVHVVPQQLMVAPHFIEDAGRVLLGLDPNEPAF